MISSADVILLSCLALAWIVLAWVACLLTNMYFKGMGIQYIYINSFAMQ